MDTLLERLRPSLTAGRFRPATDPVAVRARFGRDDAVAYFTHHDPDGVAVASPWGTLTLCAFAGLDEAQVGYARGRDPADIFEQWPTGMLVFGAIEGDPLTFDPGASGEIFHAIHGIGRWEPVAVAGNLRQFFALVLAWCDTLRDLGDRACEDDDMAPAALERFRELAAGAGIPRDYVRAALDQR